VWQASPESVAAFEWNGWQASSGIRSEMHALEFEVRECWHMPVTKFAPQCIDAVRRATEKLGYSNMEMVSGAGHDTLYIASVAPTSMIFVPCENGISHN
jgi:N-carbamoyl-L-amino-acid hydrolase